MNKEWKSSKSGAKKSALHAATLEKLWTCYLERSLRKSCWQRQNPDLDFLWTKGEDRDTLTVLLEQNKQNPIHLV